MALRLALAAALLVTLETASFGGEPAAEGWTELAVDENFSAWRDGDHQGWSVVADAALEADNDRRLVAAKGQSDGEGAPPVMLSRGDSNLYSKQEFEDVELKLEFMIPRGSNAGVKLNGLYEIQIRDTHGKKQLSGDDCGGVYPRGENEPRYHRIDDGVAPRVNAARPAGEWQSLEISFISPQFDDAGKKTANARFVRVILNGEMIHEDVELKWPTGAAWDESPEVARGPLMLQGDHGSVAFRKLVVRPLETR